jgi:hypothetical protein
LEQSGFDGYKAMVVYNVPFSTVEELQNRGWMIICFNVDENRKQYTYKDNFRIMCDRQLHYYETINAIQSKFGDLRYIIAPDPKDVIFQLSLKYKDERWGGNNLLESFGEKVYDRCKENLIFNCGTVAGDWKTMSELFLNIYLMCVGSPNQTPDQAALNTLLSFDVYKKITNFAMSEDAWACQAGTTVDIKVTSYAKDKLVEPQPILDGNIVKTSKGIPFTLVHQYDRIPEWNRILTEKYK